MSTDASGYTSGAGLPTGEPLDATADVTTVPHTTRSLDDRLTLLGIRMTYVSLSFFFVSFYFAMFYLQLVNENGMWLPRGIDHPATWIGVSETALVLLACLIYVGGQRTGLYVRNVGRLQRGLWVAAGLTLVATFIHVWELHKPGFSLQGGGYVSVFIATEGTFTVLLALTTIVSLGVANRARLGQFRRNGVAIDTFGEFYGWLSAVALINFLALYVQPFFPSV